MPWSSTVKTTKGQITPWIRATEETLPTPESGIPHEPQSPSCGTFSTIEVVIKVLARTVVRLSAPSADRRSSSTCPSELEGEGSTTLVTVGSSEPFCVLLLGRKTVLREPSDAFEGFGTIVAA